MTLASLFVTFTSTFEQLGELSGFLVLVGLKLPCVLLEPLRLPVDSLLMLTTLRCRTSFLDQASWHRGVQCPEMMKLRYVVDAILHA